MTNYSKMDIPPFIAKYQIPLGALLQTPSSNIIGYTDDSATILSIGSSMKSTFTLREYGNLLLLNWILMITGREAITFSKQWSCFSEPDIIASDIEYWIISNLNKTITE